MLFALGLLTITTIVGPIIFIAIAYLSRISTEFIITDRRIYSKYGLISRHMSDATHDKVQDTLIQQGIIGRILNFGDLRISTAGGVGYEIVFLRVDNPIRVRELIRDLERQD